MGSTAAPGASWAERTLLSLAAATLVLLLVEATIAGVLVGLTAGLGGTGAVLVGLGATLLGFIGWGVAGLAAAILTLAALRAGEVRGRTGLAALGAALLLVGVAATLANPAAGMVVGGDLFDPRPRTGLQQGVGLLALTVGTVGTALVAGALGADLTRLRVFALLHLVGGGLAVGGLPFDVGGGPTVGALAAVAAQVVLLSALAAVWPEAGAAGVGGEE